jgi:ABC-2 type transport system ATP-binding protein
MSTRSFQPARLEAVTKSYGSNRAVDYLDLSVDPGEIVALLGPNGAGKTTAVKLMLGLLRPDAGAVRIFGQDPCIPQNRRRTGAMLQVARVPDTLRVREHIDLFSSYYPSPLPVGETVRLAGLSGLENRTFGSLSGGQKQRVLFAIAICGNPDLLFLDEPTLGMDVEARRHMWERVRALSAEGKSVLLTTHYLEEAEQLAHRIIVLQRGRAIVNAAPSEMKRHAGGQRITCKTVLPLGTLRNLAGVCEVRGDSGKIEIRTTNADHALRAILLADPTACEIEVKSYGLEEAFLELTAN